MSLIQKDLPWLSNTANIIGILAILLPITFPLLKYFLMRRAIVRYRPDCLAEEEVDRYIKIYVQGRFWFNGCEISSRDIVSKHILTSSKQYHIILGDTGTGKSAFLINSYFYLLTKLFKKGYSVLYATLRDPHALDKLTDVGNKKHTILFLDAFDESIHAATNAQKMISNVESMTKEFAKVILASRTHFFDNKSDEPTVTTVARAVDLDEVKYSKYNILPFSDNDVSKYLYRKFRLHFVNRRKAKEIVSKSVDIMSRPLILSMIDSLLDHEKRFKYAHEIYAVVVERLVDREVEFISKLAPSVQDNEVSKKESRKQYLDFLNLLTIKMYNNMLTLGEPIADIDSLDMHEWTNDFFRDFSKRKRTLLERKTDSMFSFSHRSVFEYFLAMNISNISNMRFDMNLSQTYRFLAEMYEAGDPSVRAAIKVAPGEWHENIELFRLQNSRIEYTGNPDDGMIFEFRGYDQEFILTRLQEMVAIYRDVQNTIFIIGNRYVIHNLIAVNANLQNSISKENVDDLLVQIGNPRTTKLTVNKNGSSSYTHVQLIGRYDEIYRP